MVKGDCGTILVVDDDDSTRLAAVQVAVRLGYDVCAAENAELVLERLDDTTPALAVVKVELPGMSGLEVMRELHDRFGDELPVILLAHETDALERTAGLMLGADDYLQEPIDTGELLARVRRSLRRAKQSAPDANGAPVSISAIWGTSRFCWSCTGSTRRLNGVSRNTSWTTSRGTISRAPRSG